MHILVDAQIVKDYYMVSVLELGSALTGPSDGLFAWIDENDTIYVDNGGQIENEWRNPIANEWFDVWYARLLQFGKVQPIPVQNHISIRNRLGQLGFPIQGSRDYWYIKTAKSAHQLVNEFVNFVYVVTEDIDFHNPLEKNNLHGDDRIECLLDLDNEIPSYLRNDENINVLCVANYMNEIDN